MVKTHMGFSWGVLAMTSMIPDEWFYFMIIPSCGHTYIIQHLARLLNSKVLSMTQPRTLVGSVLKLWWGQQSERPKWVIFNRTGRVRHRKAWPHFQVPRYKATSLCCFFLITPSILLLQSHVICETLPRTIFCHIINLTMSHRLSAWNVHLQLQLGKFWVNVRRYSTDRA